MTFKFKKNFFEVMVPKPRIGPKIGTITPKTHLTNISTFLTYKPDYINQTNVCDTLSKTYCNLISFFLGDFASFGPIFGPQTGEIAQKTHLTNISTF